MCNRNVYLLCINLLVWLLWRFTLTLRFWGINLNLRITFQFVSLNIIHWIHWIPSRILSLFHHIFACDTSVQAQQIQHWKEIKTNHTFSSVFIRGWHTWQKNTTYCSLSLLTIGKIWSKTKGPIGYCGLNAIITFHASKRLNSAFFHCIYSTITKRAPLEKYIAHKPL